MYQGWMTERSRFNQIEAASDFLSYLSQAAGWITTATNGGAVAAQDTEGGEIQLTTSDTTVADNDETYVHTNKVFKFGLDRPTYFAIRQKVNTADNVNDCNWICGFSSAAVANSVQDDGDGPPDNYYGAVFFKADGDDAVFFEASAGTSQTTSAEVDALVDNQYEIYEIIGAPNLGTDYRLWFLVNGVAVGTDAQKTDGVSLDVSSAVVMRAIFGLKLGAATNADAMLVDWVIAKQLKA